MSLVPDTGWVVVVLPLLAAVVLAAVADWRVAATLNIAASVATLAAASWLAWRGPPGAPSGAPSGGTLLLADGLALHMSLLIALIGATTSVVSLGHVRAEVAQGRCGPRRVRLYHALYQALLGFTLLALLSDNLGVTWVAVELATIAGVVMVALPRTAEAMRASQKYLLVCGVGIALALFGTIVLFAAALPVLGAGLPAISFRALVPAAARCNATLLDLAFVFLLVGYGTTAALAPLHGWMADACTEGPAPVSAVLAGGTVNVALSIILRLHGLLAANSQAIAPGPPMMAFGLASLLLAAFSLWQSGDARRFVALSAVGQGGVAAYAFGLGGAGPVFAGLLHLTVATLIRSAMFGCVGAATQLRGGPAISGLIGSHRTLGLVLAAALIALAGLPPFGLFTSGFMIATRTVVEAPMLALPLGIGLVVVSWAALRAVGHFCLGPPICPGPATGDVAVRAWPGTAVYPALLHLLLVLLLGLAMPTAAVAWFTAIAEANR